MAIDHAVDKAKLEQGLTKICDKIRSRILKPDKLAFPDGIAAGIDAIPEKKLEQVRVKTITENGTYHIYPAQPGDPMARPTDKYTMKEVRVTVKVPIPEPPPAAVDTFRVHFPNGNSFMEYVDLNGVAVGDDFDSSVSPSNPMPVYFGSWDLDANAVKAKEFSGFLVLCSDGEGGADAYVTVYDLDINGAFVVDYQGTVVSAGDEVSTPLYFIPTSPVVEINNLNISAY